MAVKQMERGAFIDFLIKFTESLESICVESYKATKNSKLTAEEIVDILRRGDEKMAEYLNAKKELGAGQLAEIEGHEDDIDDLKGYQSKLGKILKTS